MELHFKSKRTKIERMKNMCTGNIQATRLDNFFKFPVGIFFAKFPRVSFFQVILEEMVK